MKKRIKIGDRFGRLTVIAKGRKEGNYRFYVVQCSCGSPSKEVNGISLTSGSTTSCGCKRREVYAKIGKKNRKFPKCPFCESTKLFNHGLCYKHYLQWLRGEFTDDQTRLYELALKKPQLLAEAKRKTIDNDCFWMRYILYKELNALRARNKALFSPELGAPMVRIECDNEAIFACERPLDGHSVRAIMNMSGEKQNVTLETNETFELEPWGYEISEH